MISVTNSLGQSPSEAKVIQMIKFTTLVCILHETSYCLDPNRYQEI
jgi:hypothetical protein